MTVQQFDAPVWVEDLKCLTSMVTRSDWNTIRGEMYLDKEGFVLEVSTFSGRSYIEMWHCNTMDAAKARFVKQVEKFVSEVVVK